MLILLQIPELEHLKQFRDPEARWCTCVCSCGTQCCGTFTSIQLPAGQLGCHTKLVSEPLVMHWFLNLAVCEHHLNRWEDFTYMFYTIKIRDLNELWKMNVSNFGNQIKGLNLLYCWNSVVLLKTRFSHGKWVKVYLLK